MDNEIEVGIYEAKNRLSALVEEAASGKRIWITRRGQRVAQLSSGVGVEKPAESELLEEFRRIRSMSTPGRESLKDLVEEGRR